MPADDGAHLNVEAKRHDDRLIVTAVGDVDAATSSAFDTVLEDATGVTAVELRLADVSFIDSSGLRALLHLRERADQLGARVFIASASPLVDRLLDVTGLREAFPPEA